MAEKDSIEDLLEEAKFPGNVKAYENLLNCGGKSLLTGFTGAGVSIPLAPSWIPLLKDLIDEAQKEGALSSENAIELLGQVEADALEIAQILEEKIGKQVFRARLAKVFTFEDSHTETQQALINLRLADFVTLNYDQGLESAYARQFSKMPNVIRPDEGWQLNRWLHNSGLKASGLSVIHWHGVAAKPDQMILTSDDYNKFYGDDANSKNLQEIWKFKNLLLVGFGFTDPFLTRIAETTLRFIESDNRHFAFIGVPNATISDFSRRTFSRKFRVSPIFYTVDDQVSGNAHWRLVPLLESLARHLDSSRESKFEVKSKPPQFGDPIGKAKGVLESGLLGGANEAPLYCEPILKQPQGIGNGSFEAESESSFDEILNSDRSYVISCPYEYGGTTLGRRLVYEFAKIGQAAKIANARTLPDYQAKLKKHEVASDTSCSILILDDFDPATDERLAKEIFGLDMFSRIIFLAKSGPQGLSSLEEFSLIEKFEHLILSQGNRNSIRQIARQMYDTRDSDLINSAVEKAYADLLDLCLPLIPSNIIMYLRVIYREGSFIPISRLQIVDRYIRGIIERPSDIYSDELSPSQKIDLLSKFVFELFQQKRSDFTADIWNKFCSDEKARSLSDFDHLGLLQDLKRSRFVASESGSLYFKYKLFYAYFVGQYASQRPEVLSDLIESGTHITLEGLVEVLAGLGADNTQLVTDLHRRLKNANDKFDQVYKLGKLDPYAEIEWAETTDEQERLWEPLTHDLSKGPASDEKVDAVKRSIISEQRTEDQLVIIREFSELERSTTFNLVRLSEAIVSSPSVDAALKISAVQEMLRAFRGMMQVSFVFSPIIATRKVFIWNDIAFLNNLVYREDEKDCHDLQTSRVISAAPLAVVSAAANKIGSKRLGEVFKKLAEVDGPSTFDDLIVYTCLLRSKPRDWESVAQKKLTDVGRRELYLRYMLMTTSRQFQLEVNTGRERGLLKELVATIKAKRTYKKDSPSRKMIVKSQNLLEKADFFNESEEE